MPILANLLSGLFLYIAQFFGKKLTVTAAISAAMISVVIGTVVAAYLAVKSIAAGISFTAPDNFVAMTTWVIPSNFAECVAALALTEAILAVLNLKQRLMIAVAKMSAV